MHSIAKSLPNSNPGDANDATARDRPADFAEGMARRVFGRNYPGEGHDVFRDKTPEEVRAARELIEARAIK